MKVIILSILLIAIISIAINKVFRFLITKPTITCKTVFSPLTAIARSFNPTIMRLVVTLI